MTENEWPSGFYFGRRVTHWTDTDAVHNGDITQ
jgi:hypothetical protein